MRQPTQRLSTKASIAVLALLSAWSCFPGDGHVGPGVRVASLSLVPTFTTAPSTVGVADVRSLRIVVRRLDGAVAVDETAVLTSEDKQVALDVQVDYAPPSEAFTLEVFLMNADGTVVFSGGLEEVRVPGEADGATEVPMTYVGIGAEAEFVFIEPASASVVEGESFTFAGRAFAPDETEFPGTPMRWASLDPDVASFPDEGSGVVHALQPGIARITATLLTGPSATATLTVTERPVLVRSPASLSFSAVEAGGSPASQTLQISNGGGGTLSWSVSTDAPWLTLDPKSGSGTGAVELVTVRIDSGGLSAGTYPATIEVSGLGAEGSPQTTTVTLTILPG